MIVQLRDSSGREFRLGLEATRFVAPEAASGATHDLRRYVALPGLADCHAHLTGDNTSDMIHYDLSGMEQKMRRNARLQLEGGVLLLADKGSKSALSLRFLDSAEEYRPRIQMAGQMVARPGGYYDGFAVEAEDHDLNEVIGTAAAGGATWVKLVGDWPRKGRGAVPNFTEAELSRVVAIAHDAGCRVAIHTAAPKVPGWAVRAGVDSIEHGLFLSEDDLALLGERGGAWVPTVAAMESVADWLGRGSSGGRLLREGLENTGSLLGLALEAGVAVLAGTDLALGHGAVAEEAIRLAHYGLSSAQAVHAVTQAAYDYLGVPTGFTPGNQADVVLFDGDPVADLGLLKEPYLVMRAGHIVRGAL